MKFLHRLPLLWKVLSAPAIAITCMAIYLGSTIVVFKQNNHRLAGVRDVQFPVLDATTANVGALEKIIDNLNSAAASGELDQLQTADAIATKIRANYAKLLDIDSERKNELKQLVSEFDAYYKVAQEVAQMMARKSGVPGSQQLQAMSSTLDTYRKHLNTFRDDANKLFIGTIDDATDDADRAVVAGAIIGTVGLAVTLAFGLLVARALVRQLNNAVKVAETVAAGDLTSRIEVNSNDETGKLMRALKEMNDGLLLIVSQVRTGTDSIATASKQIANGNMDLSSRTEQQASSLEEAASSMEELISTVRQNSDNAHEANRLATSASEIAVKGGEVVSKVVDTMSEINASANKIAEIIGVIDGIAFQTNILALNAAVEAARAGEQGRGFAVVASEVRSLAQRSASAAKEIKGLISDSVEKVDAGTKLVAEAGGTMNEIVASVKRVTDIMGEITIAGREQTAGIEQVNQTIIQMDQATQQNAALVEEAAAASEAMQEQANDLTTAVSAFKTGGVVTAPAKKHELRIATEQRAVSVPDRLAVVGPSRKLRERVRITSNDEWEEF